MKKQWITALLLFLLIPLVLAAEGMLLSVFNPEIAAGHPNYARNYHRLSLLRNSSFLASVAIVAVLWILVCLLVIRSKGRSQWWLWLAALGPLGFPVLAMLNDQAPAEADRYTRFLRRMNWLVRGAWELGTFVVAWVLAYDAMLLKRTLMIRYEAATTGVSTAQIIAVRDASGGMWAFSEGNEVMYFVVLLYLLLPVAFTLAARMSARVVPSSAR